MKIVFATLILSLSFQVQAKVSAKDTAGLHLLKYNEFVALDRDDRAAYIEELRLAAVRSENADLNSAASAPETSTSTIWMNLLLGQAHAAAGDMCIYAGYVSQKDSQNHCSAPAGSSGSCGSGQTQCNPLLYGYGPSSGGICTSSRSTPTNDCEEKYQKIPNYKAYQVADQLVGKDMKAKFDAQAAQLNSYCGSANAADQKGLCDKLKSKTEFMKAKIAASEQRKKEALKNKDDKTKAAAKAKEAADKATKDKLAADKAAADKAKADADAAATKAKAAATTPTPQKQTAPAVKAPAAPISPSGSVAGSKGADGNVPVTPQAPTGTTTAAPQAGSVTPSPAVAAPKPEVAKQAPPEVKKSVAPACIKNKEDLAKQKDNLPPDLQSLDEKNPVCYAGSQTVNKFMVGDILVTSTMKISITSVGKFKLTSNVLLKPAAMTAWQSEDDVASICPTKTTGVYDVTLDNGSHLEVTMTDGKLNVKSSEGSMPYGKVTEASYTAKRASLVGAGVEIWNGKTDTGRVAK